MPSVNSCVSPGRETTSGWVASIRCSQLVPLRWAPTRNTIRSRSGESASSTSYLCGRGEGGLEIGEAADERAPRHVEGDGGGPSDLHTPVVVDVSVQGHAGGVAARGERRREPHLVGLLCARA